MGENHYRPKYQQPHSICVNTGNPALDDHIRDKEHRRQKYKAKYIDSKKDKKNKD